MYEIPFSKMVQPRLGATWAYNGKDTVYASYATYNPAASSLPRAASWDRNVAVTINAYFDQNGVLFGTDPARVVLGEAVRRRPDAAHDLRDAGRHVQAVQQPLVRPGSTAATAAASISGKTPTTTRVSCFDPPAGIPRELYIPDLATHQIGADPAAARPT